MGRGLSDLQRWILAEAQKRDRLYYFHICEGYYGWKRRLDFYGRTPDDSPGPHKFSPAQIGEREYARVMSTISRSCDRLAKRDLVMCLVGKTSRWSAVEVTEKGAEYEQG